MDRDFVLDSQQYARYYSAGSSIDGSNYLRIFISWLQLNKNNWSIDKSLYRLAACIAFFDSQYSTKDVFVKECEEQFTRFDSHLIVAQIQTRYLPEYPNFAVNGHTYIYLKEVSAMLSKTFVTRIYQCKEKEQTVVFVENIDRMPIKYVMTSIAHLCPWFVPYITEELKQGLLAFFQGDDAPLHKILDTIPKSFDDALEQEKIATTMQQVANVSKDLALKDARQKYQDAINNIKYAYDILEKYESQRMRAETQITMLENSPSESSTDLVRFFTNHKNTIRLHQFVDDTLYYYVNTTLDFYDEGNFQRIVDNNSSWFYHSLTAEQRKLFKKIFLEHKGKFLVSGGWKLCSQRRVMPYQGFYDKSWKGKDYQPHPHIVHYGCTGANEKFFTQFAEQGDWEMGVEQSIGCIKNLNFGDSTVCARLAKEIRWDAHCILKPDGTLATPKEIITEEANA